VARRGFLSRIVGAIRDAFTRDEEPRRTPVPPQEPPGRGGPERRRRAPDPYLDDWRGLTRERTGYLNHKDIIDDMAFEYNLPEDEKQELWHDYLTYLVGRRGTRAQYRYRDPNNPFWTKWNIDPDSFDWHAWREAMGYPHGRRR